MEQRGYLAEDASARADALSVDDPRLANSYRAAHHTFLMADRGDAPVDRMLGAFLVYRELLEFLLDRPQREDTVVRHGASASRLGPVGHRRATSGCSLNEGDENRLQRESEVTMHAALNHSRHRRRWTHAIVGSAAVALALAVVAWTASDAVEATIAGIAVLMVAALALWSGRRRPSSEPRRDQQRSERRS